MRFFGVATVTGTFAVASRRLIASRGRCRILRNLYWGYACIGTSLISELLPSQGFSFILGYERFAPGSAAGTAVVHMAIAAAADDFASSTRVRVLSSRRRDAGIARRIVALLSLFLLHAPQPPLLGHCC